MVCPSKFFFFFEETKMDYINTKSIPPAQGVLKRPPQKTVCQSHNYIKRSVGT